MSQSSATETATEFGAEQLAVNAKAYAAHRQIVNAASRYDSVDDAIAALKDVWKALEEQSETGAGYTPATELGFGSDSAAAIADSLLGRRNGVGQIRKLFAAMGK